MSSNSSKRVVYRGGIANFEIPSSWVEEYEPEGGGTFYEPRDDAGTLRLNVISFESENETAQEMARSALAGANGCSEEGFALHYEVVQTQEGQVNLEMHRWQIAVPAMPHSVRLAIFTYAIRCGQLNEPDIAREFKVVDDSIRKATFSMEQGGGSYEHQADV